MAASKLNEQLRETESKLVALNLLHIVPFYPPFIDENNEEQPIEEQSRLQSIEIINYFHKEEQLLGINLSINIKLQKLIENSKAKPKVGRDLNVLVVSVTSFFLISFILYVLEIAIRLF